MRALICFAAAFAVSSMPLCGQDPLYTNTLGMEFVLIHPGSMQVGVFEPTCPDPNAPARGGGGRGGSGVANLFGGRGPGGGSGLLGAGGPGGASGRGGGAARGPRDPRTQWNADDYKKCAELAKQDASPGFRVNISKPYYIGKYEVTQAEWKKVMGTNPSVFQNGKVTDNADKHPVDNVTWADTQAFLKKLNALEKTKLYRLPSEFEWEYAGRAGGDAQISWPEIREMSVQGIGFGGGGGGPKPTTAPVGTKKPNAWGLYDMLGNVWEWVEDYYNDKIFPDPTPPKTGTQHVLKGGGFASDVKNAIYATHGAGPGDAWDVGFRVVRDVK